MFGVGCGEDNDQVRAEKKTKGAQRRGAERVERTHKKEKADPSKLGMTIKVKGKFKSKFRGKFPDS